MINAQEALRAFCSLVESGEQAAPVLFVEQGGEVSLIVLTGDLVECLVEMAESGSKYESLVLCTEGWRTFLTPELEPDFGQGVMTETVIHVVIGPGTHRVVMKDFTRGSESFRWGETITEETMYGTYRRAVDAMKEMTTQ